MTLALTAMMFARHAHGEQRRKYTGAPYTDHLAEVAGIVATLDGSLMPREIMVATAWLHDVLEDTDTDAGKLQKVFGTFVAYGVGWLTDAETGNRAERKAASRKRLARAPGWVQSIKCADLISNTSSIVQHDPKFAIVYLAEKRALLEVLTKADPMLRALAQELAEVAP